MAKKKAIAKAAPRPKPVRAKSRSPRSPAPAQPAAAPEAPESASYRRRRLAEGERQRRISATGRDIGPVPAPADPEKRTKALGSLAFFLRAYFGKIFYLPFSDDHLEVIKAVENVIINGGLWLLIVYRGFGKSGILSIACLWAIANGYARYPLLVAATGALAKEQLEDLKTLLDSNEELAADFPDLCFAFRELEGQSGRCRGQTIGGEPTGVKWGTTRIVFAKIPKPGGGYYPASGAVLKCAGLLGATRGVVYTNRDGERLRPDLVLPDDPQTDASARSPYQCDKRLKLIRQALDKLAGPDKSIATIVLGTVIEKGDLIDQLGDRKISPDFFGTRYKLLKSEPTNKQLLDEYATLLVADMQAGDRDLKKANAFWRKHLKALWKGAEVSSLHKKKPHEIDALQHAMNWKLLDPNGFACEAQGEPIVDQAEVDAAPLTVKVLYDRLSHVPRGSVIEEAVVQGGGIDVQHQLLYWCLGAMNPDQGGAITDYGAWPEQDRSYFLLREAQRKIKNAYKNHSLRAGVTAALTELLDLMFSRPWKTPSGVVLPLDCVLVDAADGKLSDTIFRVCQTHRLAAGRALPAIGKGLKPTDAPMHLWGRRKGDIYGDHWLSRVSQKRGGRYILIDTNYWKSTFADSLTVPAGDESAFYLPGVATGENRLLVDHFLSESRARVRNERDGNAVDMWTLKPQKFDNHLWDSAVLSRVAQSVASVAKIPSRSPAAAKGSAPTAAPRAAAAAPAAATAKRSRSKVSYPSF